MSKLSPGKWLDLEQKIINIKTNGKRLVDLTTYQGIALWWFIRFRLYHSTQTNWLAKLLMKNTYIFSFADFLYDFLTSMLSKVLAIPFKVKTNKRGPTVLITAQSGQWREIRDRTGRLRKCDSFFDSLINEMKRRDYEIVTICPLKYSLSGIKTMIEKLKSAETIIHKEFNAYWSAKTWKKEYYANKHFKNLWKKISENDEEIIDLLKKYPITRKLFYYFNSIFGYTAKNIEMANEVVKKEKPDLILATSEYGTFERALVVAGKLNKIPTLAIQHGSIGPIHKGYIYSKNSISPSGSIETPYCPIPDKTAVYGQYDYDLLTNVSSYPPNSVVITGQPRYDILAVVDNIYSRKRFCSKLNLDSDRRIVLVALQHIPIFKRILRSALRALKNFPELQIVIKPHPLDKTEWYKIVMDEEKVEAVTLSRDADTFEALYACDLLVAGFSTVITEAIILGKPVVTVHLVEGEDPTPYYKEATLRVYRDEELFPTIGKVLYDKKTSERLKKARKKFVSKYAYSLDGRATERVADLIEEMIKNAQTEYFRKVIA